MTGSESVHSHSQLNVKKKELVCKSVCIYLGQYSNFKLLGLSVACSWAGGKIGER